MDSYISILLVYNCRREITRPIYIHLEHLELFYMYRQNAFQKVYTIFNKLSVYENKAYVSLMHYPCHLLFTYILSIPQNIFFLVSAIFNLL